MAKMKSGFLRASVLLRVESPEYLPVLLAKKGIKVIDFRLLGVKECLVTIDCVYFRKFFAICKNMCYNILSVKYKGILSPVMLIIKKAGVFVGIIAFLCCSLALSNLVYEIDVIGSGSIFKNETILTLNEMGVKKYSTFSSIDYESLAKNLLKSNERLAFVSAEKKGNRLVIKAELGAYPPTVLDKQTENLVSLYDGVIEEIAVLRGTALKSVGDKVSKGDELVGAYVVKKDESIYQTFIIARVKILATEKYFHPCENPSIEDARSALVIAEFLSDGEVTKKSYEICEGGVEVTLTVRYVT